MIHQKKVQPFRIYTLNYIILTDDNEYPRQIEIPAKSKTHAIKKLHSKIHDNSTIQITDVRC